MRSGNKKNPALVELVLVILFFALSSVVLVQVFVKARVMSETSRAETLGLVQMQDLIERWKGTPKAPEHVFSGENGWVAEEAGEGVMVYVNGCGKDLVLGADEEGFYELRAELWREPSGAGELFHIRLGLVRRHDGETLTELETLRYQPGT